MDELQAENTTRPEQPRNQLCLKTCFPLNELDQDLKALGISEIARDSMQTVFKEISELSEALADTVLQKAQAHYDPESFLARHKDADEIQKFICNVPDAKPNSEHSVEWLDLVTVLPEALLRSETPIPELLSAEVHHAHVSAISFAGESLDFDYMSEIDEQDVIDLYLSIKLLTYVRGNNTIDASPKTRIEKMLEDKIVHQLKVHGIDTSPFLGLLAKTDKQQPFYQELLSAITLEGALQKRIPMPQVSTDYLHEDTYLKRLTERPSHSLPLESMMADSAHLQLSLGIRGAITPRDSSEKMTVWREPIDSIINAINVERRALTWLVSPSIEDLFAIGEEPSQKEVSLDDAVKDSHAILFAKETIERICKEAGVTQLKIHPSYLTSDYLEGFLRKTTGLEPEGIPQLLHDFYQSDATSFTSYIRINWSFREKTAPLQIARQLAYIDYFHGEDIPLPPQVSNSYIAQISSQQENTLFVSNLSLWPDTYTNGGISRDDILKITHGMISEDDIELSFSGRESWNPQKTLSAYETILRQQQCEIADALDDWGPHHTVGSRTGTNSALLAIHEEDVKAHPAFPKRSVSESDFRGTHLSEFHVTTIRSDSETSTSVPAESVPDEVDAPETSGAFG